MLTESKPSQCHCLSNISQIHHSWSNQLQGHGSASLMECVLINLRVLNQTLW
ncbi:hypothetical protein QUF58_13615 [Anaerolineales bacterium HSG24]|nr:hypothetical protein [Anaerolineales bacterium HSG24]